MTTIKISGVISNKEKDFDIKDFTLEESYLIGSNRSESKSYDVECDSKHITQIIFDDSAEWIGPADEIRNVFRIKRNRGEEKDIVSLPTSLSSADRSGVNSVAIKLLNVFQPKIAHIAAKELAILTDQKIMPNPRHYFLNEDFDAIDFDSAKIRKDKKYLLLIHGTISSTVGSFSGMKNNIWKQLFSLYDGILALDHYTLSVSPFENALDVLEQLPAGMKLDIMSHSRGGLVADVLARCDRRNSIIGYTNSEIDIMKIHELDDTLQKINKVSKSKGIEVGTVVRVACPAGGTTLLSGQLDHFLNGLLNTIGIAFGDKINIYYKAVQGLLMQVVAQRMKADAMPGLWSMIPDSDYQKINNNREIEVASKLVVIAGDGKVGGSIANTILVIFSNLFYKADNDLVVNTKSMKRGIVRKDGLYQFVSRDSYTSHFNYFKNSNSTDCIYAALTNTVITSKYKFDYIGKKDMDRGIGLGLDFSSYQCDNVSGTKPIVVVLPGIMGSTLKNQNDIWLDFFQIAKGNMVNKLAIDDTKVAASGIIKQYYFKLCETLKSDYDVLTFPFDWRKSVVDEGAKLLTKLQELAKHKQTIHIVAHSMGGLVVREAMKSQDKWLDCISLSESKVILLGTPWLGSYLIMEVLTGHSRRVKQLAFLDFQNKKTDVMKVIAAYPGIYELLPIDDRDLQELTFWQGIEKVVGSNNMVIPDSKLLKHFEAYKKKIKELAEDKEKKLFENVFYIAGHDDTIFDYTIKDHEGSHSKLVYLKTDRGDGSVTWELGIPKKIKKDQLYYSKFNHTNLANEKPIIEAIQDIISHGNTAVLSQIEPVKRGAEKITEIVEYDELYGDGEEAMDNIMKDFSGEESYTSSSDHTIVNVSVLNADLKQSKYAVMVGHFLNDGLYSAEKSLSYYLDNKLAERHKLGFYPGKVGESELIFHNENKPKGALVIGMGKQGELTSYLLSQSVEMAVLKYAFFFRDNFEEISKKKLGKGISTLLIGSGFAGFPKEDSIKAILLGVQNANDKIKDLDNGLLPIEELEFVDYYEDVAQSCYSILNNLQGSQEVYKISLPTFKKGLGSRKQKIDNRQSSWWHTFTTEVMYDECILDQQKKLPKGLSYTSTSNLARAEKNNIASDLKLVESLATEYSMMDTWDPKLSKAMMELLVPNDFKSTIRNQSNIVWKMDEYAAQFPWEMFHDYLYGGEPTFVNTGMVRQLLTEDYRNNPAIVTQKTAIVVGNPDYTGSDFGQLAGAEAEANEVIGILSNNGYAVNALIQTKAPKIINELYSADYKIMHFAAHGVYEKDRVGIVLGPDQYLTPGTIDQLSAIPEFIFINCCFSGTTKALNGRQLTERTKLAANIGTQLIRMGVKAIVVTGWAVNDDAAKLFAKTLYNALFDGYEFGVAVQMARRMCYETYKDNNTWGAYQCYGDHYYRLSEPKVQAKGNQSYVMESQLDVDLDNLLSSIQGQLVSMEEKLKEFNQIKNDAMKANLETANVKEKYGYIMAELGMYNEAITYFSSLGKVEKANFTVKALEQLYSLRGKQLIGRYRKQDTNNLIADFESIINDLKLMMMIGATSERLALLGSACKRAAIVDQEKRIEYLHDMLQYFTEAYKLIPEEALHDSIYPLSNCLLSYYLVYQAQPYDYFQSMLGLPKRHANMNAYLKELVDNLVNNEALVCDYYTANALPKVMLIQFVYSSKTSNELKDELKKKLFKSIHEYATVKQIIGEIEHYEFMSDMLIDEPAKQKFLIEIVRELTKYIR